MIVISLFHFKMAYLMTSVQYGKISNDIITWDKNSTMATLYKSKHGLWLEKKGWLLPLELIQDNDIYMTCNHVVIKTITC